MLKKIISGFLNSKSALNEADFSDVLVEITDDMRHRIQSDLLSMYKDILQGCEKYRITPFLCGGSALGAVRHQGFIPWDDDLDIGMTRMDYQRFVKIFDREFSDRYFLSAPNYSAHVKTRFPKILKKGTILKEAMDTDDESLNGLFLDIFILEGVPTDKVYRKIKGTYCNFLMFIAGQVSLYQRRNMTVKQMYLKIGKLNYYMRMTIGFLFSYRSAEQWFNKVDQNIRYNRKQTKEVCFPTGRKHYFGEILEKEKLFPLQLIKFEDIEAPVFKDVDYYLSNLYGDYMQIPPVEKREKHFVVQIQL